MVNLTNLEIELKIASLSLKRGRAGILTKKNYGTRANGRGAYDL